MYAIMKHQRDDEGEDFQLRASKDVMLVRMDEMQARQWKNQRQGLSQARVKRWMGQDYKIQRVVVIRASHSYDEGYEGSVQYAFEGYPKDGFEYRMKNTYSTLEAYWVCTNDIIYTCKLKGCADLW